MDIAEASSSGKCQNNNNSNIDTFDDDWDDSQDDILVKVLESSENEKLSEKEGPLNFDAANRCNKGDKTSDPDVHPSSSGTGEGEQKLNPPAEPVVNNNEPLLEPLHAFRPGYLWVSDFSSQIWCEQKLHYTYTLPIIPGESPAMTEGSNLHLARELAAHDKVDVKVASNEDIWAIKVINLLTSVQGFLNGQALAREVPVFGAPFGQDVFVVGLIDELRFDRDHYNIDLSDLKTRTSRYMPSKSQEAQHRLQVMLYKKLFDDLVQGNLPKELIAKHLRLKLETEFGEDILTHLQNHGLECRTLSQLLDHTYRRLQSCTCIRNISIEYVYQQTRETLCHKEVVYDEADLQQKFRHCLKYWTGSRPAEGVEIEEAWKCQKCEFAEVCEWRERKAEEYASKNCRTART